MSLPSRAALLLALAAAICASAVQAAPVHYTSFWTLGDSLSDPGNLYAATGGAKPASPPYYQGRFSNGPVWAEHTAAAFTAKHLPTGNFAFGGARAISNTDDAIPDLATQIGMFSAASRGFLGTRPVASLWIGANDLISTGILPGTDAAAVGRAAAQATARGALALGKLGVRDIAVFTLPDLGQTPAYALLQPLLRDQATAGSLAYNRALDRQIPKLEKAGLTVIEIDTAGLFSDLIRNPTKYGVADTTLPCLIPGQPACSAAQAMDRAFFDGLHPNATVHGAIAGAVGARIAPIPLPLPAATLLAALTGLGLLKLRRPTRVLPA